MCVLTLGHVDLQAIKLNTSKREHLHLVAVLYAVCVLACVWFVLLCLNSEKKQLTQAEVCYFYSISCCEQTTSDTSQVTYRT